MPSLKILFFADTHLGFDYPLRTKMDIRRRGPDFFNNFHRILNYAEQSRPDFLVHGGDFFFRSKVPQVIVDMAYSALFDFVNRTGIPIYIVPGNHERSRLPQSIYLAHPLINVFNRPCIYQFEKEDIKTNLYGFPFFRGDIRGQFTALLKQCGWGRNPADIHLIILHQAVDGAQVGPANYTFRNKQDVININDIPPSATAVLSGHIHRRQVLYAGSVPFIYPGSIERTSFAEKDEQKGIFEITFAPAKNFQWKVNRLKFIRLPSRPMYYIHLNGETTEDAIKNALTHQCKYLPEDSIVCLKRSTGYHNKSIPTVSFIRSLLPRSFNLHIAPEFYRVTGK